MTLRAGEDFLETDMINASERDIVTPSNDEDKLVRLENNGKISSEFINETSVFTATTAIALTNRDPVGINIEGKVAKAFRNWVSATNARISGVRLEQVDTNKFVVGYITAPAENQYNLAVAEYNSTTDTVSFGSVYNFSNIRTSFDFCKIDTNKLALVYASPSDADGYVAIIAISGTACSVSSTTKIYTGTVHRASCCSLDTNKFAFIFQSTSGTENYQGVATVSGSVVTVGFNSSSVITNINTATAVHKLVKLSTSKHVILNSGTGHCVVIDSASAYTAGSVVQSVSGSGGGRLISESSTSFIVGVTGSLRKCSVSGTTISNDGLGVSITNDGGGDLCILDGVVYEAHYNATTASLCGIYRITHSTDLIRTQIAMVPFTSSVLVANIGTAFVAYQSADKFFSSAMASNFIGVVKADYAQGVTATVFPFGKLTGLSGLIKGSRYGVADGSFTLDTNGDHLAISATELIVK